MKFAFVNILQLGLMLMWYASAEDDDGACVCVWERERERDFIYLESLTSGHRCLFGNTIQSLFSCMPGVVHAQLLNFWPSYLPIHTSHANLLVQCSWLKYVWTLSQQVWFPCFRDSCWKSLFLRYHSHLNVWIQEEAEIFDFFQDSGHEHSEQSGSFHINRDPSSLCGGMRGREGHGSGWLPQCSGSEFASTSTKRTVRNPLRSFLLPRLWKRSLPYQCSLLGRILSQPSKWNLRGTCSLPPLRTGPVGWGMTPDFIRKRRTLFSASHSSWLFMSLSADSTRTWGAPPNPSKELQPSFSNLFLHGRQVFLPSPSCCQNLSSSLIKRTFLQL